MLNVNLEVNKEVLELNVFVCLKFGDWSENYFRNFVCVNKENDLKEMILDCFGGNGDVEYKSVGKGCYLWSVEDEEFGGIVLDVNEFIEGLSVVSLMCGVNLMLGESDEGDSGFVRINKVCVNNDIELECP